MGSKALYEYRKANGICVRCGKPNDSKTTVCIACKKAISDRNKKQYREARSVGLCVDCKKRPAMDGGVFCEECRDRRRAFWFENSWKYQDRTNRKAKSRRKKIIKKGLCPKCGRPNNNGKIHCDKCLVYMQEVNRQYRKNNGAKHIGIPRAEWPSYSWCVLCGVAVNPGEKMCGKCMSRNVEQAAKMRVKAKEKREERLRDGICTLCGKAQVIGDKKVCEACNERLLDMNRKWRESRQTARAEVEAHGR